MSTVLGSLTSRLFVLDERVVTVVCTTFRYQWRVVSQISTLDPSVERTGFLEIGGNNANTAAHRGTEFGKLMTKVPNQTVYLAFTSTT